MTTPKGQRQLIVRQEMEAGRRALRRHQNVEALEKWAKQKKIRIHHDLQDVVRVEILERLNSRDDYALGRFQVLATLTDPGKEFPSDTLITQLRLVLE